jgi:hypothetical protein
MQAQGFKPGQPSEALALENGFQHRVLLSGEPTAVSRLVVVGSLLSANWSLSRFYVI